MVISIIILTFALWKYHEKLSINIVITMNTIVTDGTRTVTFDIPMEEVEKRITTFAERATDEGRGLPKSVKTDEEERALANEIKTSLSKSENLLKFAKGIVDEGKDKFPELLPDIEVNAGTFIENLAKNIALLHRHNIADYRDYVQTMLTLADVSTDALCTFVLEVLKKGAVITIFGHGSDIIKDIFGL